MKIHYTYIMFNVADGRYYIGCRSCAGDPHEDPYRGSSMYFGDEIRKNLDWEKFIIDTYPTRYEARLDETRLFNGHIKNGLCVNIGYGHGPKAIANRKWRIANSI